MIFAQDQPARDAVCRRFWVGVMGSFAQWHHGFWATDCSTGNGKVRVAIHYPNLEGVPIVR